MIATTQDKKTALVLRTCNADLTSYGGFKWPESGPIEAPQEWWGNGTRPAKLRLGFNPDADCGAGLHGLLWGASDWSLLGDWNNSKWQVVKVERDSIVDLGGKVKFPRGEVVYCGSPATAIAMTLGSAAWINEQVEDGLKIIRSEGETNPKHASSGHYSKHEMTGEGSTVAIAGLNGMAKAASRGSFALAYFDDKAKVTRYAVGIVGEGGILADT